MFGSSVSSTAAGSTRILCATICPYSHSYSYSLPTTTNHFSSHVPTTSVSSSAQRLRCVPIKAMAETDILSVPKSASSSPDIRGDISGTMITDRTWIRRLNRWPAARRGRWKTEGGLYLQTLRRSSQTSTKRGDSMADFAKEILKHAVDQQRLRKGKKTTVARAALSSVVGHSGSAPGSSGSPVGAAKVPSPSPAVVSSSTRTPKRAREDVVDVDADEGFMLPQCFGMRGFLEKYPLQVPASEKKIIADMSADKRGEVLARDAAAVMRLLETALTLNEESAGPPKEMQKLQKRNEHLETKVLGLENRVQDLEGKQENFVRIQSELRVKSVEMEKMQKEVEELRALAEEKEKLEQEVADLKAAMAPAEDEPGSVRGLLSRADLVGEIQSVGGKLVDGAKFGFNNAVAQLKIVNGEAELKTEGIGFWRKVVDGQIVLPEEYQQMEEVDQAAEEEEGMEEDVTPEGEQRDDEEGHGESDQ